MPNECWSKLTLEGCEADVQRFVQRVVSEDLDYDDKPYPLDFEAHVPVPPEVRKTMEVGFGEPNIRDWAFSAWGCLQPMSVRITERSPGRVGYFMTTGWTAPIPWLETVAAAE